jgi:hypothetical protein
MSQEVSILPQQQDIRETEQIKNKGLRTKTHINMETV